MERIVKAEILWSRKCLLKCSYCKMVTGQTVKKDIKQWRKGVDNLVKFGCRFMPIYGAEPLEDFDLLPEFIAYLKEKKVHNTIITCGISTDFDKKLKELIKAGLESISTSFDVDGNDKWSKMKGDKAFVTLNKFKSWAGKQARDLAIIMTITKLNYKRIPEVVVHNSKMGVWTLFDMIHYDRGQPGSKTSTVSSSLLFTKEDLPELKKVLQVLLELKKKGYMLHASEMFLSYLIKNIQVVANLSWNCAKEKDFPAWVTINYDAEVFPCDDFQPVIKNKIYIDELVDKWEIFKKTWKQLILEKCPGCCWNTHIDAHLIKRNQVSFNDYVHGRDK